MDNRNIILTDLYNKILNRNLLSPDIIKKIIGVILESEYSDDDILNLTESDSKTEILVLQVINFLITEDNLQINIKQYIGHIIYNIISHDNIIYNKISCKLIGMLLELDVQILVNILDDNTLFKHYLYEGIKLLQELIDEKDVKMTNDNITYNDIDKYMLYIN